MSFAAQIVAYCKKEFQISSELLVGVDGFEPPTLCL